MTWSYFTAGGYVTTQTTYGMPPPPPAFTTTHIVHQPAVIHQPVIGVAQRFGQHPCNATCATCRASIVTTTAYEVGTFTWLIAAIICFLG